MSRADAPRPTTLLRVGLLLGALAACGLALIWPQSARADSRRHEHAEQLYQCPMHPQIVSRGEGRCPICKMFLKPQPKAVAIQKRDAWARHNKASPPPITEGKPAPASQPSAASRPAGPRAKKARGRPAPANAAKPAGPGADYTCPMHRHISKPDFMRCPVCGMHLLPRDKIHVHDAHGLAHETFVCPMHPEVVTDEAGRCPICGMDLELKRAAAAPTTRPADDASPRTEATAKSGVVTIDPVVVQNMGVRIAPVTREPLFRHIRALGSVDVAEDEISVVNLRYSGWVEKLYVDETGVKVKRGQWLAEVYSPELVSAQEEYLLAVRSRGKDGPLAQSARRRLEFFGMEPSDIDKLARDERALRTIRVRAPRAGYILHKNIVKGARVNAGMDIFRVGNLQKIWVNAEVYEFDAPWVENGAPATMELSYQTGKRYSGRVSYVYPTLNAKSRTLTVRLEFDNPGLSLKPGMFTTVRIEARRRDGAVALPSEAILHSGERQMVFVALGGGRYEKRDIVTGLSGDRHRTEVLSGVEVGERVVVSGQFLLDSECQLQEAVQKFLDARLEAKDPTFRTESNGRPEEDGLTYWTCPMHPHIVQDEPGSCPICGMDLVEKTR